MSKTLNISIDGTPCKVQEGTYLIDAARQSGIYIPSLCNMEGVPPKGACRMCSVKVNGKLMTSCTTRVQEGMQVESALPELEQLRSSIVEMLFVEGNHFCPSCEKSGECELQALAYRYQMTVPRYPYLFPLRKIDSAHPKIIKDHNRCILCKRCVRAIKDENGKSIFAFLNRGHETRIYIDPQLAEKLTDELAEEAVRICPVGAIMLRGKGFEKPVGTRKFDRQPIGLEG